MHICCYISLQSCLQPAPVAMVGAHIITEHNGQKAVAFLHHGFAPSDRALTNSKHAAAAQPHQALRLGFSRAFPRLGLWLTLCRAAATVAAATVARLAAAASPRTSAGHRRFERLGPCVQSRRPRRKHGRSCGEAALAPSRGLACGYRFAGR